MKISLLLIFLLLPLTVLAVEDPSPSFSEASVVAHVRVREAEITSKVGGYENWKITGQVIESFKGKFRKGDEIEYFHGTEVGFQKNWFLGEKVIFLSQGEALENSTLPPTKELIKKLRLLCRSNSKK